MIQSHPDPVVRLRPPDRENVSFDVDPMPLRRMSERGPYGDDADHRYHKALQGDFVRQAHDATPHVHPHGEVLALNVGSADVLVPRAARHRLPARANALGGTSASGGSPQIFTSWA